ncbi:uncharacterized protein BDZ99DRAFT_122136 [Mytilinidion resinicola]|uniref:Uncharacterized protein n=1 Tax=Mytilinidion resinicola TaxID=574789 RepID=A0A6A6Z3X3_9PEZI|nr:uncharacterized protein BDZ99DRAFT_122136 [Mytilinidion resinicola]KAF2815776.1 hypothetical protein BDZ99DRAFT_122136 [Mytilinidion resinicola]
MTALATGSQPAPGLQVTAPDDDMEITSEIQYGDDDIDIDLDLGGEYTHHHDDDQMLEDAMSDQGHAQHQSTYPDNDDNMFDDELDDNEGMMQDNQDHISIPDEHLTDVSELGHEEATQTNVPNVAMDPDDDLELDFDFEDEVSKEAGTVDQALLTTQAQYEQTVDAIAPTTAEQAVQEGVVAQSVPATLSPTEPSNVHPVSPLPAVEGSADNLETTSPNFVTADATQNEEHAQYLSPPGSLGEERNDENEVPTHDHSGSPYAAHDDIQEFAHSHSQRDDFYQTHPGPLHPVIVIYADNEPMSLFHPRVEDESQTYFLEDESIAHETIYELLQACRTVLGDTISDEDELEMDIAKLGLCIREDCVFASKVKFSQILYTYLSLEQHDGVHDPDPLYMTLTLKTRFSTRLAQLSSAASQGQGISQLTFLGHLDEENSEYPLYEDAEHEHSEHDDAAIDVHEQLEVPNELQQNEGYDDYEAQTAPEPHITEHGTEGAGTYESAENKSDDLFDFDNEVEASTADAPKAGHVATGAELTGPTENDVGAAGQQVERRSESKTALESHKDVIDDDDLIDYSDDEVDTNPTPNVGNSGSGPSSASSTVQGDATQTPKGQVTPAAGSQPNHPEDAYDELDDLDDDFGPPDAAATTLNGVQSKAVGTSQSSVQEQQQTHEDDYDLDFELEKELEQALETNGKHGVEQDLEVEPGQLDGVHDAHHADPVDHESGFDFGEGFDENYAPDFDEGHYDLQDEAYQGQEQGFSGQESYETHGEHTDNGGDGAGFDETNYGGDELGDHLDFDGETLANPDVGYADNSKVDGNHANTSKVKAVKGDPGYDSDSIDYDDDEDESPPAATTIVSGTLAHQPSTSPPAKRSRDDEEDDEQDLHKKTRLG